MPFGLPCLALLLVFGCSQWPQPRVYPDKPDPNAGQRAIELFDVDKHGYLTAKELEKLPGLKAAVRQVDRNNDGKIYAAEISARIKAWADSASRADGRSCIVKHNGWPLAGATVKLVPEPFLGGGLKTAEGTTNDYGLARMSVAGSGQRGISPGFYRVEIIKGGSGPANVQHRHVPRVPGGRQRRRGTEQRRGEIQLELLGPPSTAFDVLDASGNTLQISLPIFRGSTGIFQISRS